MTMFHVLSMYLVLLAFRGTALLYSFSSIQNSDQTDEVHFIVTGRYTGIYW